MSWFLYLDDQINDPVTPNRHPPENYIGAASAEEAKKLVLQLGVPSKMDLDCDLADGKDVMYFLKWLEANHHDSPPKWNVHSANIVAVPNVKAFMTSWHKVVMSEAHSDDCPWHQDWHACNCGALDNNSSNIEDDDTSSVICESVTSD